MGLIGFSTGALACGDFLRALTMLRGKSVKAVELSALRMHELPKLAAACDSIDVSKYEYVSVHAPSRFSEAEEQESRRTIEAIRSISLANNPPS
jgi:hypothetical protein